MNLQTVLVTQVVLAACSSSILIPSAVKEDRTVVPRLGRASTWETVLRQAAYQSLTKYTGFTDSLDEKIQRDQILWTKILEAHVQRTNKQDGDINIKTGTLVDEPSGTFEFRREKSIQSCSASSCLDNSKLLAVWKIQRIKPNHLVVRMKVSLNPSTEDTYQYTPSLGLKLQSSKEIPKISSTTYIPEVVEIPKKNKTVVFPEQVSKRNFASIYRAQPSQERPVTLYYVPTEQSTPNHVVFPQTNTGLPSHDLIAQQNTKDRYGLNSQTVKAVLTEFQHDVNYDGFLPSMGPTENPFKSTPTLNQYRPDNKPNKSTPVVRGTFKPFKQTTSANFKPSTHFVQYSEQDPLYYLQGTPTEKIPTKSLYGDSKSTFKDAFAESPKLPIKESIIGNRKIPTKDLYVDNYKFPPKGMYWDNKEYPKQVFVNTGRPFELTSLKEIQEPSINYHIYTTPKEGSHNHLANNYNKAHKYPAQISTQQPESKFPVHVTTQGIDEKYLSQITPQNTATKSTVTRAHVRKNKKPQRHPQDDLVQTLTNKYPIVVTTEDMIDPINLSTQETIQKYPPFISTEEPETKYLMSSTPQVLTQRYQKETHHRTTVKFPSDITTSVPYRHSIRVTTEKLPEASRTPVIANRPVQVPSEDKTDSTERDEAKNRAPTATLTYSRRRPIGLSERRHRKPVRKTESQEIKADSAEGASLISRSVVKHPTSINQQLLEIESTEKESSLETGTNNISSETDSTEEIRDVLTTEVPTTTKYSRKYNRKGNRNWNYTRNNNAKNRTKIRNSTYFSRWGERVRSTTDLPTRLRINHKTKEVSTTTNIPSTTTTSTTPKTTTTIETIVSTTDTQQADETRDDSEVYESQTVSSIEIAPSDFAQNAEITTTATTKKEDLITTTCIEAETTLLETTPIPTTVATQTTTQQTENKYKNKTPEEIVNELTALGLRNSSQTEEVEPTPETQTSPPGGHIPPDLISRLQAGQYNVNLEDNETSLVVNRVSKSISFKTSRGLSGRILQPTNIIPVL